MRADAPVLHPTHPDGNVVRHVRDPPRRAGRRRADVVVTGEYTVGMQDQAFLGPESGSRCPPRTAASTCSSPPSGCTPTSGRWRTALGMAAEKVRLHLAGVGGAFGAREDLSMQIHACLLALRTGKPVKIVYGREESFFGHVHRHPAVLRYEHGATRDGDLVYVRAEIILDGGAYASTTSAVTGNAATLGAGPYRVPNVHDRLLRRLHEQPAVRRDARVRRGAGVLRLRVADGQARRGARHGPGRRADPQRGRARARSCRPGRSSTPPRRSPSC